MSSEEDHQEEVNTNKNTAYVDTWSFWLLQPILIVGYIIVALLFHIDVAITFTSANILHSVITFFFMHWLKGSPLGDEFRPQSKYYRYTFWEQIDFKQQFTPTKKYLLTIPCILLLITFYTSYQHLWINLVFGGFAIVPKLPALHKVRLFGINAD